MLFGLRKPEPSKKRGYLPRFLHDLGDVMDINTNPIHADYDPTFVETEVQRRIDINEELMTLVRSHSREIEEFIHILGTAVPMRDEFHLVRVTMWDDRLNSIRKILTNIMRSTK